VLVTQQHLDGRRDGLGLAIVNRSQHPRGFGDGQVWHPRAMGDERLGGGHLLAVISRHEPNQHVGVNGPHGAF
jgi:hypothetical protein